MNTIDKADRIKNLPPYLFAKIDQMKDDVKKKGVDIIDLGVGDPDLPTPPHIIKALQNAAQDPQNHRYPSYSGMLEFRDAVAQWYQKRFQVTLDPRAEVISLIGSKEGIAHIPLAYINPQETVLIPEPGYPVYSTATLFAGGNPYFMPLLKENNFLPDFSAIPQEVLKQAKLMYLNYPNNPTAAVADRSFFEQAVTLAQQHQIILCHDAAYTEIFFDGYQPLSILEIPGAKEVAIEFHSLSKTYNMTGWRVAFAAGNPDIIGALGQVKTQALAQVRLAIGPVVYPFSHSLAQAIGEIQMRHQLLHLRLVEVIQGYALIHVEVRDGVVLDQFSGVEGTGNDEGQMPPEREALTRGIHAADDRKEIRGPV